MDPLRVAKDTDPMQSWVLEVDTGVIYVHVFHPFACTLLQLDWVLQFICFGLDGTDGSLDIRFLEVENGLGVAGGVCVDSWVCRKQNVATDLPFSPPPSPS